MYLSSPNFNFTIPSVHDGTQLDCRIYLPRELQQGDRASSWKRRGTILAHPYAPLGGCYDDPVLSFVGGELLRSGYVVGTFNFRGAGGSEGRTSWTARPELADYVSFYGFMLYYLGILESESSEKIHVILGGYSFGSMIASHLPGIEVVAGVFENAPNDSAMSTIRRTAKNLAMSTNERLGMQVQPLSMNSGGREVAHKLVPQGTISYLLISPILPPISSFLTLFGKFSIEVGISTSAQGKHIPCPRPADQLSSNQTLAIYGNEDTFTPASKLRSWSDGIAKAPGGMFKSHEIGGAGHFWREDGVESQARSVLCDWLGRIS